MPKQDNFLGLRKGQRVTCLEAKSWERFDGTIEEIALDTARIKFEDGTFIDLSSTSDVELIGAVLIFNQQWSSNNSPSLALELAKRQLAMIRFHLDQDKLEFGRTELQMTADAFGIVLDCIDRFIMDGAIPADFKPEKKRRMAFHVHR